MKFGYIRVSLSGATEEQQRAALASVGVLAGRAGRSEIFVDLESGAGGSLSARHAALTALVAGDEFVVESAGRLASTYEDALQVIAEIGRRGAVIRDVATARLIPVPPEAAELLAYAASAETQGKQERAAKARQAKEAAGVKAGPPMAIDGERLEAAKEAWADPARSAEDIAKEFGVARRTLYRRFGPKGLLSAGAQTPGEVS